MLLSASKLIRSVLDSLTLLLQMRPSTSRQTQEVVVVPFVVVVDAWCGAE
jgi:hypothetical protein